MANSKTIRFHSLIQPSRKNTPKEKRARKEQWKKAFSAEMGHMARSGMMRK